MLGRKAEGCRIKFPPAVLQIAAQWGLCRDGSVAY
jgi:hypothetical protein